MAGLEYIQKALDHLKAIGNVRVHLAKQMGKKVFHQNFMDGCDLPEQQLCEALDIGLIALQDLPIDEGEMPIKREIKPRRVDARLTQLRVGYSLSGNKWMSKDELRAKYGLGLHAFAHLFKLYGGHFESRKRESAPDGSFEYRYRPDLLLRVDPAEADMTESATRQTKGPISEPPG